MTEPQRNTLQHYPLSKSQLGIWYDQLQTPNSSKYNIAEYLILQDTIDPVLFRKALLCVFMPMEALHLRVVEHAGTPSQVFCKPDLFPLQQLDFSQQPAPEKAALEWLQKDLWIPYSLTTSTALYRHALLKLGSHRFIWYHHYHHMANDGFGLALLVQDVVRAYHNLQKGIQWRVPKGRSYLFFLQQEADYRRSATFVKDQAYWRNTLRERPDVVTLASRHSAPHNQKPIRNTRVLSLQQSATLRYFVAHSGGTLPQISIALASVYLYRLSGANRFILGIPTTARMNPAARQVVGTVSNQLPLLMELSPHTTLRQHVMETGRRLRFLLRRQRYRLHEIRKDFGLRATDPDFFGMVVNVMSFDYTFSFGQTNIVKVNLSNGPVNDMVFTLYDMGGNAPICVDVDANAVRYSSAEVAAHTKRFVRLLAQVTDIFDTPIGRINLLTASEKQQLQQWNATNTPCSAYQTIVEWFEAQAKYTPNALAIVCKDQQLTYAELNRRANQLAHYLQQQSNIDLADQRMGICVKRSPEMVIGLLGILKANATYLPLDPDDPQQRLVFVLEDSQANVLLTQKQLLSSLPQTQAKVILLDAEESEIGQQRVATQRVREVQIVWFM